MAKKQLWIVRDVDGWLCALGTNKDLKNYLEDLTDCGRNPKGIQVASYELVETIPIKTVIKNLKIELDNPSTE